MPKVTKTILDGVKRRIKSSFNCDCDIHGVSVHLNHININLVLKLVEPIQFFIVVSATDLLILSRSKTDTGYFYTIVSDENTVRAIYEVTKYLGEQLNLFK